MLLKKLNLFIEQVATYLKDENKLSSSSSSNQNTTTECIKGITNTSMSTTNVMGPDSAISSLSNTYQCPPPHEKGTAGIDSNDIKPMMVPAIPYKNIKKKKKRKLKIK